MHTIIPALVAEVFGPDFTCTPAGDGRWMWGCLGDEPEEVTTAYILEGAAEIVAELERDAARNARTEAIVTIDANIAAEIEAEIKAVAALGAATSALAIRGLADELVSRQATRARLEAMKAAIRDA